MSYQV
jgi:ribosomal protein L12E/L44/L45/RPP1/RPP2